MPMGLESDHRGVIDLVSMKALTFEGEHGEELIESEIPAEFIELAREKREEMLDAVSLFSDELTEAILAEEPISEDMVQKAIRKGTLALELTPVLMGSAYKNKGVQPLLDAIVKYLPSPLDIENDALDLDREEERVVLGKRVRSASGDACVQTRSKPLRAAHIRSHLPGDPEQGRHHRQHENGQTREGRTPGSDARR